MIPSKKTIANQLGESLRKEYGNNIDIQVKQIRQAMEDVTGYKDVDRCLDTCNQILKGYGVEETRDNNHSSYFQDIGLLYVNMGDAYVPTIIYDTRKSRFYVTCWEDIIEAEQKRFSV